MGVVSLTPPSGFEMDYADLLDKNRDVGLKRIDELENEINLYVDKVKKEPTIFAPFLPHSLCLLAPLPPFPPLSFLNYITLCSTEKVIQHID